MLKDSTGNLGNICEVSYGLGLNLIDGDNIGFMLSSVNDFRHKMIRI